MTKRRLPEALLAVATVIGAAGLWYLHRDIGPWGDEWNFISDREGLGVDQLLGQHNGHLVVLPVLIYKFIIGVFGIGVMWPFYALSVGLHLAVACLVFVFIRRRANPWLALMAGLIVMFMGTGGENIIWSFQIGMLGSMAAGIGALLVFESGDSRAVRVGSASLLAVSIAFAGTGVIFLIGLSLYMFWTEHRRKAFAVAVVPGVLFALWFLVFGLDFKPDRELWAVVRFAVEMTMYAFGGLIGLDANWGRVAAVLAFVGLFVALSRDERIEPKTAVLVAMPVAFWVLTATQRAGWSGPEATRYVYVGVILILLAASQVARPQQFTQGGWLCIWALFAVSLASNAQALKDTAGIFRGHYAHFRADMTAATIAGPDAARVSQFDVFDPTLGPGDMAELLELIGRADGRLAYDFAELAGEPNDVRGAVDASLLAQTPLAPHRAGSLPSRPGRLEVVSQTGSVKPAGACLRAAPGSGTGVDVRLTEAGLVVEAVEGAEVFARRYGDKFSDRPQTKLGPGIRELSIDRGVDDTRWIVRLRGAGGFTVCAAK